MLWARHAAQLGMGHMALGEARMDSWLAWDASRGAGGNLSVIRRRTSANSESTLAVESESLGRSVSLLAVGVGVGSDSGSGSGSGFASFVILAASGSFFFVSITSTFNLKLSLEPLNWFTLIVRVTSLEMTGVSWSRNAWSPSP